MQAGIPYGMRVAVLNPHHNPTSTSAQGLLALLGGGSYHLISFLCLICFQEELGWKHTSWEKDWVAQNGVGAPWGLPACPQSHPGSSTKILSGTSEAKQSSEGHEDLG